MTKDQLLQLASHYEIIITSKKSEKRLKDIVKEIIRSDLIKKGLLKAELTSLPSVTALLSEATIQLRLKELFLQEKQLKS